MFHVKKFLARICDGKARFSKKPRKAGFVMLIETQFLGHEHALIMREDAFLGRSSLRAMKSTTGDTGTR